MNIQFSCTSLLNSWMWWKQVRPDPLFAAKECLYLLYTCPCKQMLRDAYAVTLACSNFNQTTYSGSHNAMMLPFQIPACGLFLCTSHCPKETFRDERKKGKEFLLAWHAYQEQHLCTCSDIILCLKRPFGLASFLFASVLSLQQQQLA